jgi:hypothetical protein
MALSATQIIEIPELPAMGSLAGNDLFATHANANNTTYKTSTFQISAFVRNAISVDTAGLQLAGPIRLPGGVPITTGTTTDPLFIGVSNTYNLVANNNTIQTRNNGAVSILSINPLGGDVIIGSASSSTSMVNATITNATLQNVAAYQTTSDYLTAADLVFENSTGNILTANQIYGVTIEGDSVFGGSVVAGDNGVIFPDGTAQFTAALPAVPGNYAAAWARFSGGGFTFTSFGVSAVNRVAQGRYRVTLENSIPTKVALITCGEHTTTGAGMNMYIGSYADVNDTQFDVNVARLTLDGGATNDTGYQDPNYVHVVVFASDDTFTQTLTAAIQIVPETTSSYATNNNGIIRVTVDSNQYVAVGGDKKFSVTCAPGSTVNRTNDFSQVSFTGRNSQAYSITIKDTNTGKSKSKTFNVPYGGSTINTTLP